MAWEQLKRLGQLRGWRIPTTPAQDPARALTQRLAPPCTGAPRTLQRPRGQDVFERGCWSDALAAMQLGCEPQRGTSKHQPGQAAQTGAPTAGGVSKVAAPQPTGEGGVAVHKVGGAVDWVADPACRGQGSGVVVCRGQGEHGGSTNEGEQRGRTGPAGVSGECTQREEPRRERPASGAVGPAQAREMVNWASPTEPSQAFRLTPRCLQPRALRAGSARPPPVLAQLGARAFMHHGDATSASTREVNPCLRASTRTHARTHARAHARTTGTETRCCR